MLIDLSALHLAKGSHSAPEGGTCLLEATALFADEPMTDHPTCVSPVLADFGIALNDRFDDSRRQELKRFIPELVNTRDGHDEARGYLALDWLIRTYTPVWLDLAGLTAQAQELRELRRIVDMPAAQSAGPVVRQAQTGADAAWAAAWDAAWAAAWDAAWDAAGDAAWDAAGAAAGAAAWAAAWDAAGAAAGAALTPTVDQMQTSAIDLYARMIRPVVVEQAS